SDRCQDRVLGWRLRSIAASSVQLVAAVHRTAIFSSAARSSTHGQSFASFMRPARTGFSQMYSAFAANPSFVRKRWSKKFRCHVTPANFVVARLELLIVIDRDASLPIEISA